MRRHPAWRHIVEALQEKPADPDIDDPELGFEPAAAEEKREIFEVLAHADALGEESLRGAVRSAIREDGRFVPPLVLVEGEYSVAFPPFDALEAAVAILGPKGAEAVVPAYLPETMADVLPMFPSFPV